MCVKRYYEKQDRYEMVVYIGNMDMGICYVVNLGGAGICWSNHRMCDKGIGKDLDSSFKKLCCSACDSIVICRGVEIGRLLLKL